MVKVGSFFLTAIITIREGLGSFLLATISTVSGGIYLHFLSQCSDEKEQQFFDKRWDFDILELACLFVVQTTCLCNHNYNKGRFGFFFLDALSTVGGGIYLCFLSRCNDEKEQQFFDKGWDFDVLELACLLVVQAVYPCYHNYNKGRFGFIFSCCHKYNRWWDLFSFSLMM